MTTRITSQESTKLTGVDGDHVNEMECGVGTAEQVAMARYLSLRALDQVVRRAATLAGAHARLDAALARQP